MTSSPQRNIPQFNQREFTAQKMAQFMAENPEKSEAQIKKMVDQCVSEQKKRLLATDRASTNQRNKRSTNQRQLPQPQQFAPQIDPRMRLDFHPNNTIAVIVPQENANTNQRIPASDLPNEGSSTGTPDKKKTKKIKKDNKKALEEYKGFYRHYNEKLQREHKKWTGHQRATIIKLLWRKKRMASKKLATHLLRIRPQRNPLTGRKYFGDMKRKELNMEGDDIRQRWCVLPQESRKYLGRLGNGGDGYSYPLRVMPKTIRFGLLRKMEPVSFDNILLSFINHN